MTPPTKSTLFSGSFQLPNWNHKISLSGMPSSNPKKTVATETVASLAPTWIVLTETVHSPAPTKMDSTGIKESPTLQSPPGFPTTPLYNFSAISLLFDYQILSTHDTRAGPVRFYTVLLAVDAPRSHVDYLLLDNENGGLWYGRCESDLWTFHCAYRSPKAIPVAGFKLGNKLMKPISPKLLFPLYDATKMTLFSRDISASHSKWQDVLARASALEKDYTSFMRLATEIAACERLRKNPSPYVERYLGVQVIHFAGRERVSNVVVGRYMATLWQFVCELRLLKQSHVSVIKGAIRKALDHIHDMGMVHRRVFASNVYVNWHMVTKLVPNGQRTGPGTVRRDEHMNEHVAEFQAIVLGNFDRAMDFPVNEGQSNGLVQGIGHDRSQAVLLEKWLRIPLAAVPPQEISGFNRLQSGVLEGEQQKEMEDSLQVYTPNCSTSISRSGPGPSIWQH